MRFSVQALIALLFWLTIPALTMAESIEKYGLTFPIDQISQVDSDTYKVTVFGHSTLISKNKIDDYVLGEYFKPASISKLKVFSLQNFIQGAVEAKDLNLAMLALEGLLQHQSVTKSDVSELFEKLSSNDISVSFYKKALKDINQISRFPEIVGVLVYGIAVNDVNWLRTEGVRFVYLYGAVVKNVFKENYFKLIAEDKLEQAKKVLTRLSDLYGVEDSSYLELSIDHTKIVEAFDSILHQEVEGMYLLTDLVKQNKSLAKALPTLILARVHQLAQNLLKEGQASKTLLLLSWLDLQWRTPTTHKLVVEALKGLKEDDVSSLFGTRIERFLSIMAIKDPEIKETYVKFVERDIQYRNKNHNFSLINSYFDRLRLLRPDPNAENDSLRIETALAMAQAGFNDSAKEIYSRVQTKVSQIDMIRLLLAGILVDRVLVFSLMIVPILLIGFLVFRRRAYKEALREEIDFSSESEEDWPIFAKLAGKGRDPSSLQYEQLLRVFELERSADFKDIKTAFRNSVKRVHPDLNPDLNQDDRERFLNLTQTYEKIVKLRKRLGLPLD